MSEKLIIDLVEDDGKKVSYEVLDVQTVGDKVYVVAYPTDGSSTEVVIFREEPIKGSDQSRYVPEDNNEIINNVYEQFKIRMGDHIDFADGNNELIATGEVVEFNNKEYVCFKVIENNGTRYVYFITKSKPVEIKFTKQVDSDGKVDLVIINDPYEKEKALELLQKSKEDE